MLFSQSLGGGKNERAKTTFYEHKYISYTMEYHSTIPFWSLPSFDQGTGNSVPPVLASALWFCTVLGEIPLLEELLNSQNTPFPSKGSTSSRL